MNAPFKRASTYFLKAVIILIGIVALAICAFAFPAMWHAVNGGLPEFAPVIYPAFIGLYATAIPFFFALYQAFKLLHYIDTNSAFSELSVRALRNITYSAIAMSVLYAAAVPLAFVVAELDDAPGLGAIALAIVFAPLIVATFAAVLKKLVQSAIDLKTENDLTV